MKICGLETFLYLISRENIKQYCHYSLIQLKVGAQSDYTITTLKALLD